jgi:hypothetical protein
MVIVDIFSNFCGSSWQSILDPKSLLMGVVERVYVVLL